MMLTKEQRQADQLRDIALALFTHKDISVDEAYAKAGEFMSFRKNHEGLDLVDVTVRYNAYNTEVHGVGEVCRIVVCCDEYKEFTRQQRLSRTMLDSDSQLMHVTRIARAELSKAFKTMDIAVGDITFVRDNHLLWSMESGGSYL